MQPAGGFERVTEIQNQAVFLFNPRIFFRVYNP
jgi:hypothetical protein